MNSAFNQVPLWLDGWKQTGRLVLLLDFDGTLAPIVSHPQTAAMPEATHRALEQLSETRGVDLAIVSGRALDDVRDRVRINGIYYAGNHGLQIQGPRVTLAHSAAVGARPLLNQALKELSTELEGLPGVEVEDKDLTLTVHYRRADSGMTSAIRRGVREVVDKVPGLLLTEGKKVLEVRPAVEWGKGEAVDLLLKNFAPPAGSPAIYIGDDVTDESAFRVVSGREGGFGYGVLVSSHPPAGSAAMSCVETPEQVGLLLSVLAAAAKGVRG